VGVDDCPPAADTVAGSGTESSPAWEAPAAFFFLRTAYAIGLLVVSMVGLARNHRDREAQAIGWFVVVLFVVVLFVLSPNQDHFILLLVAVTLLLPGMSRRWAAGLLILYVLAERPQFPWDARFFPKAWADGIFCARSGAWVWGLRCSRRQPSAAPSRFCC
jgi:hypothetical protein